MKMNRFQHRFVASIPEQIEPGLLYISLEFSTMMHLCACGCGREVVTPLSPKDWRMTYDGQSVSVHPSVGSWSLPCRSHYVIKSGRIRWAGDWTDQQIANGRRADQFRKRGNTLEPPQAIEPPQMEEIPHLNIFQRFWRKLSKVR
jgi:hypothetical protein